MANWLILDNCSKFNEFVENRLEHFLQHCQAIEDSNNTQWAKTREKLHFHGGKIHLLQHSDFTKFFFSSDEVLLISKLNSQAITLKIILPFVIASLIKGAGNNTTSIIIDGTGNYFSLLQFSKYNYICNISDFTKKFLFFRLKIWPRFCCDRPKHRISQGISQQRMVWILVSIR